MNSSIEEFLAFVFRSQWLVILLASLLLLALAELGYRAGLRIVESRDEPLNSQAGFREPC